MYIYQSIHIMYVYNIYVCSAARGFAKPLPPLLRRPPVIRYSKLSHPICICMYMYTYIYTYIYMYIYT